MIPEKQEFQPPLDYDKDPLEKLSNGAYSNFTILSQTNASSLLTFS